MTAMKAPVHGCNDASSGDHGVLEGDSIPSLKSHRHVTEQKCCLLGVLCNGNDMPAGFMSRVDSLAMSCHVPSVSKVNR